MTPKEIAERLKVVLPGFVLPTSVDAALYDALSQVLPEPDIRSGVVLDTIRREDNKWKGHVEYLLLLDRQVLHVKGTLIEGPKVTLRTSHHVFPLAALRRVTVTTDHEHQIGQTYLRAVELVLNLGDGTSFTAKAELPEAAVNLVLAFARSLLEALR